MFITHFSALLIPIIILLLFRLSERNCIEIITKLIEINLLDVIFTTDGKEYITPQYLIKEIKDELYVSGGKCKNISIENLKIFIV